MDTNSNRKSLLLPTVCFAGDNDDCSTRYLPPAESQENLCCGSGMPYWFPWRSLCNLQCKYSDGLRHSVTMFSRAPAIICLFVVVGRHVYSPANG